jgi:hypothetical protein
MPDPLPFLTEDAVIICQHRNGKVQIEPTQHLVTINGRRILVEDNPENRPIKGCPNYGVTIKPCTSTLKVREGYSRFLRIEQHAVCLSSVVGLTDGTPPGGVEYQVRDPGQKLVASFS